MGETERPDRLAGVYDARDSRQTAELYDEWAAEYERDVLGYGYTTPAIISGLLGRHVDAGEGSVLDAGAGTGMMGEILKPLGYTDLSGIDLSGNMLDLARKKDAYQKLRQMELGEPLDFPDDDFRAVVAAGVFTPGHAPPHSFDELLRVTNPGGHIIFSLRSDTATDEDFEEKQRKLEEDGRWRLVEVTEPYRQLPLADPNLKARCFVYRVV
ncbi:MAG: methyltransferase domain-containing protein [Rubrobacteraceae bacterium]